MKFSYKLSLKKAVPFTLLLGVILYASGGFSNNKSHLKPVDRTKTCMASNMYSGKQGIEFNHDEKKYYGCSEMCIKNLQLNTIYRYGTDPLSGKLIDKALAFIAADDSGKLFYFENEKTFKTYQ